MFKNRKSLDFLSTIKRGDRISKASIFFFILMSIIIYQALFLGDISVGLIELMGIIIAGDLGGSWIKNQRELHLEKIKKTNDNDMSNDDIKNL